MNTTTKNDNATVEGGEVGKNESNKPLHFATGDRLQKDPLLGWYGLAAGVKQYRTRPMKKSWQRKGGM
jgi:hypothetical protein